MSPFASWALLLAWLAACVWFIIVRPLIQANGVVEDTKREVQR